MNLILNNILKKKKNLIILWCFFLIVIFFNPFKNHELIIPLKNIDELRYDINSNTILNTIYQKETLESSELDLLLDRRKFLTKSDDSEKTSSRRELDIRFYDSKYLNLKTQTYLPSYNSLNKQVEKIIFFDKLKIQPITGKPYKEVYLKVQSKSRIDVNQVKVLIKELEKSIFEEDLQSIIVSYNNIIIKIDEEFSIVKKLSVDTKSETLKMFSKIDKINDSYFAILEKQLLDFILDDYAIIKMGIIKKSINKKLILLNQKNLAPLNIFKFNEMAIDVKMMGIANIKIFNLLAGILFFIISIFIIINKKKLYYLLK